MGGGNSAKNIFLIFGNKTILQDPQYSTIKSIRILMIIGAFFPPMLWFVAHKLGRISKDDSLLPLTIAGATMNIIGCILANFESMSMFVIILALGGFCCWVTFFYRLAKITQQEIFKGAGLLAIIPPVGWICYLIGCIKFKEIYVLEASTKAAEAPDSENKQ